MFYLKVFIDEDDDESQIGFDYYGCVYSGRNFFKVNKNY